MTQPSKQQLTNHTDRFEHVEQSI